MYEYKIPDTLVAYTSHYVVELSKHIRKPKTTSWSPKHVTHFVLYRRAKIAINPVGTSLDCLSISYYVAVNKDIRIGLESCKQYLY